MIYNIQKIQKEDKHNFVFVNEEGNFDIKQNIKNTVPHYEDTLLKTLF